MSDVVRIGSNIIIHPSKLWKARFSILCDVMLCLVRLQGKCEIESLLGVKGVNTVFELRSAIAPHYRLLSAPRLTKWCSAHGLSKKRVLVETITQTDKSKGQVIKRPRTNNCSVGQVFTVSTFCLFSIVLTRRRSFVVLFLQTIPINIPHGYES